MSNNPISNFKPLTSNTAITLVALVITIIVLLILAGVTLNMVIGENGMFGKANTASENTKIANAKEIIRTAVLENEVYKNTNDTRAKSDSDLQTEIETKLTNEGYKIEEGKITIGKAEPIDIAEEITKSLSGEVKKEKWQILLETAEINYKRFKTLESFIDDSTEDEKTKLTSNANVMNYLRENSDLIATLKSQSNYEKIAKYLLSTDEATNTTNYNLGLPCYITNGNKLYLGGSWREYKNAFGSYSTSESSNYIKLYISYDYAWEYTLATTNPINLSKFNTLRVKGYCSNSTNGGSRCGFGTPSGSSAGSAVVTPWFSNSNTESEVNFNINDTNKQFTVNIWIADRYSNNAYLYYAYIY